MFSTQQYFGFDPRTIPGCALWLDAADSTTFTFSSGSNISQWNDKSGNGSHAVGNTGTGTYSATALNSTRPGVQITATGNMRAPVAAGTLSSGVSAFVVYQKTGANQTFDALIARTGPTNTSWAGPFDLYSISGTNTRRLTGSGGPNNNAYAQTAGVAATRSTTPTVYHFNVLSTAPTTWNESINGTTATYTLNIITGTATYSDTAASVWIGTRADGNTTMIGTISEIIIYSGVVTTNQRQQVEGYLAWKWGIQTSLPISHPFRPNPNFQRMPQPPDFGPMLFWWDAAEYSSFTPANPTTGTSITGWRDKISGLTLTNSNASPTWSSNGVVFTNSSSTVSTSTQNLFYSNVSSPYRLTQTFTIVVAHAPNLFTNFRSAVYFNAPAAFNVNPSFFATVANGATEGNTVGAFNGAGTWLSLQQAASVNTGAGVPRVDSILSAPSNFMWTNGTENTYSVNNIGRGTTVSGTATLDYISMSTTSNVSGNRAYDGTIYEVLVYSSNLSSNAIRQVEGYLGWKWKAYRNLVNTHPFYNIPTSSSAFDPRLVSGINAWFDGADPAGTGVRPAENSAVSTWVNKTGGTNGTAVGTGALYSSNGVTFATPKYYTTSIPYSSNYTIFLVATNTTNTPCYTIARNSIGGGRGPTITQGYTNATRLQLYEGDGGVFPIIQDPAVSPFIISVNYTNLGAINLYYNGTNTSNTTSTATYNSAAWDTIGQAGAGVNTGYYNGTMKDLIFYSNVLTTSNRQRVEGYLAWKWGLQTSLPTTHPYYKFRP